MKQGGPGALVKAIKLVRATSFMSLKEAKDFVDTITARLSQ
jgi:ribosomal protein L7/L12